MIRLLSEDDAEAYVALRHEALLDAPLAFGASPEDDFALDLDLVRARLREAPESVIFGAHRDGLVGSVGLYRSRTRKTSHKAVVWGMYVKPACRGEGHGRELVRVAVEHARGLPGIEWVQLSVSSSAPEARRLYASEGFVAWGTEPDALRQGERSASETRMALRLDAPIATRS